MYKLFFYRKRVQPLGWIVMAVIMVIVAFVILQPDKNVHVIVCDVGEGDAILVIKGSSQILIDGGPNDTVLSCLSDYVPFWDKQLELVVLTHGDADHMTGLIEVLRRYEVGRLVTNNLIKETERFKAFKEGVLEKEIAVYAPKTGDKIRVGSLEFKVLWPEERLGDELVWLKEVDSQVLGANTYSQTKSNEQSIVMGLSWGEFDVLLTGDMGVETEEKLRSLESLGDVEVLKVGHHGSKGSSSREFLETIKPELAVISVGRNNYGHPTQEVLGRLEAVGAKVLRTDERGSIEVVSNGKGYWVEN